MQGPLPSRSFEERLCDLGGAGPEPGSPLRIFEYPHDDSCSFSSFRLYIKRLGSSGYVGPNNKERKLQHQPLGGSQPGTKHREWVSGLAYTPPLGAYTRPHGLEPCDPCVNTQKRHSREPLGGAQPFQFRACPLRCRNRKRVRSKTLVSAYACY